MKESRENVQGGPMDPPPPPAATDLLRANDQLRQELATLKEVEQQVIHLNREVEDTQREVIFRLAEIVEARSRETGGHVTRVAELSHLLAIKSGLGPHETELLRAAAPMHDVGKVGIPDAILFNPGRLPPDDKPTRRASRYAVTCVDDVARTSSTTPRSVRSMGSVPKRPRKRRMPQK